MQWVFFCLGIGRSCAVCSVAHRFARAANRLVALADCVCGCGECLALDREQFSAAAEVYYACGWWEITISEITACYFVVVVSGR